jgi:hypothetical protein
VYPDFRALRARLADLFGAAIHLTGAGPTLYALFDRADQARDAAGAARRLGLAASAACSIVGRPRIRASQVALAR